MLDGNVARASLRAASGAFLEDGAEFRGPAIVLEETATTYVDADYLGRVDESGCLFLRKNG